MKKISIKDLLEQEDIFKGIRQSAIDTVEALNKVQTELKDSAKIIQNDIKNSTTDSAKGLKEFSNAATAASKVMKDAAIVAQQQAKAEQQKIKVDQEIVKLEKLKAQEIARATKEAEKAAKLAAQESSAYAQLSKELNNARKAYKDLAVTNQENTTEGKELLATITQLDAQLKEVDATVGQHQRNVGNYGEATKSLKLQLRELTQALQQMDESDPRFQQMAQQAGQLKDQIQDTQAVVKATAGSAMENFAGSVAKTGQIGVAAFQGIESSMVLLGVENEAVLQSMQKLQALAGLGDALQTLGGLGDMLTEIRAGFVAAATKMGLFTAAKQVDTAATTANTIAAGANTTATVAQTTATNAANTATKGLNASMLMNPYVLVAAAIAAMAVALYKLTQASDDEKRAEQARQEVQEENLQLSQEMNSNIAQETAQFRMLTTQLTQTNAGSRERQQLIDKINSQYGTTLKNLSNEAAFQAQVNAVVQDYMNMMRNKALLEMNVKKHTKAIQDQENANTRLFEANKKLEKIEKEITQVGKEDWAMNKQRLMGERNIVLETINVLKEQIKIGGELEEVYAKQNFELTQQNDLNKYEPPAPPIVPQQQYNKELEKTVDLTKEIQDEQIKQIKDDTDRAFAETKIAAKRRIEEVKSMKASSEQKAQLIKEIETNLQLDLTKIDEEYIKKNREQYEALKEFRKRNAEEIAENERQENIKLYEDSVAFEDKQNHAKLASLSGTQREEFEERLQFQNELNKLNKLKQDGAFASQEDYEKAVANLKKKYNTVATKLEEEKWKTTQEFAQKTADYFKKKSEEKVKAIDEEIAASEKQAETLKQLAAEGNINAQQSLAEQQRIINEANLRKQKELRKQQRIEVGLAAFKAFSANADKDNPLASTIKDVTGLLAFINSLPMFYDGTEDTGTNGRGVDGKGGFHAILHPNERVLPKSLNQQIGNLSNEELARIAQDYQNGRLIGQDVAHSSLDFAVMVNKIDELKEVIKNKPETNIALGEITQSAMQIVEQKRTGNTVIYNRYRVNR